MLRTCVVPQTAMLSSARDPFTIVEGFLHKQYVDAPQSRLRWCRGYYERCNAYETDGKGLVAVYFPPAVNYVFDFGYENLVIFKTWLKAHVVGDPTFPHWDEGKFYSTRTEEAPDILYPFTVGDLIVGTKREMSPDELSRALADLQGVSVTG